MRVKWINKYPKVKKICIKIMRFFGYFDKKYTSLLSYIMMLWNGKVSKESKEKLELIKESFKGKRCIIIGNGPSLTIGDLEKVQTEITFASNKIFDVFNQTSWRPNYYAIFDYVLPKNKNVQSKASLFGCDMKFFKRQSYLYAKNIKGNNCYINTWVNNKYLKNPKFSDDLLSGIYGLGTVTYVLIQIAAYMGFTEIYLIGVDNQYSHMTTKDGQVVENHGAKSYFVNSEDSDKRVPAAIWEMDIAYMSAKNFCDKNGIKIFNATRGGNLEVFDRVYLDDIL
ncbi:MAG: 6-hydroxymethylpterin diphosphokinase MptE-like protein [Bacillota bacterium]